MSFPYQPYRPRSQPPGGFPSALRKCAIAGFAAISLHTSGVGFTNYHHRDDGACLHESHNLDFGAGVGGFRMEKDSEKDRAHDQNEQNDQKNRSEFEARLKDDLKHKEQAEQQVQPNEKQEIAVGSDINAEVGADIEADPYYLSDEGSSGDSEKNYDDNPRPLQESGKDVVVKEGGDDEKYPRVSALKSQLTHFVRAFKRVCAKPDDPVRLCAKARARWDAGNGDRWRDRCFQLDLEFPVEDVGAWVSENRWYHLDRFQVELYGAGVPYLARMVLPLTRGEHMSVEVADPALDDRDRLRNQNAFLSDSEQEDGDDRKSKKLNEKGGNVRVRLSLGKPQWKEQVRKKLEELKNGGDHFLMVELKRRPERSEMSFHQSVCAAPLTPSALLNSLDGREGASDLCFDGREALSEGAPATQSLIRERLQKRQNQSRADSLLRANLLGATATKTGAVSPLAKAMKKHPRLAETVSAIKSYRPRQRRPIETFMRYATCPVSTLAGVWALLFKKDELLRVLPSFPGLAWAGRGKELREVLPPVPDNMLQAFDLGSVCAVLKLLVEGGQESKQDLQNLLHQARGILGIRENEAAQRGLATVDQVCGVRDEIIKILEQRSIVQRVGGLFRFVNMLWLFAIGGIAISVGPTFWLLTEPIRELIMKIIEPLAEKIKVSVVWLFEKLIMPAVARLHEMGVWEMLLHSLSFLLQAQAARMPSGASAYVALSGLILKEFALRYSYQVHDSDERMRDHLMAGDSRQMWETLHMFLRALIVIPVAIQHQSTMLGYLTVSILLAALGFGIWLFPFCYCIGWDSEDSMARTSMACGSMLFAFVTARIQGLMNPAVIESAGNAVSTVGSAVTLANALQPFAQPVSVGAGIGFYLSLLIMSNKYYHSYGERHLLETQHFKDDKTGETISRRRLTFYGKYNVAAMVSMLSAVAVGRVYQMAGLANTATVFLVLWLLDKVNELVDNFWPMVFLCSTVFYHAALWLNLNPGFIADILSG